MNLFLAAYIAVLAGLGWLGGWGLSHVAGKEWFAPGFLVAVALTHLVRALGQDRKAQSDRPSTKNRVIDASSVVAVTSLAALGGRAAFFAGGDQWSHPGAVGGAVFGFLATLLVAGFMAFAFQTIAGRKEPNGTHEPPSRPE